MRNLGCFIGYEWVNTCLLFRRNGTSCSHVVTSVCFLPSRMPHRTMTPTIRNIDQLSAHKCHPFDFGH